MEPTENTGARTPFEDLSNTTYSGEQFVDAKKRKTEMQRARRATMSEEKRNKINRKRREARQQRKVQSMLPESSTGDDVTCTNVSSRPLSHSISYTVMCPFVGGEATLNKENEYVDESGDWLHRNNSYQPHCIDVDSISTEKKENEISGISSC